MSARRFRCGCPRTGRRLIEVRNCVGQLVQWIYARPVGWHDPHHYGAHAGQRIEPVFEPGFQALYASATVRP